MLAIVFLKNKAITSKANNLLIITQGFTLVSSVLNLLYSKALIPK